MNMYALGSGSVMSAYATSQLAGQSGTGSATSSDNTSTTATTSTATPVDAASQAMAAAALAKASHTFQATSAQQSLETKETALASDLRKAMGAAGVTLGGSVEFSIGSDGKLAVSGSDDDRQAVETFLQNDTSQPGFSSQLTSLTSQADTLSSTIRQNAAISQAARYAGSSSNVLTLYSSLLQQQDTSPAVFSMSGTSSSLTYPGVLTSTA